MWIYLWREGPALGQDQWPSLFQKKHSTWRSFSWLDPTLAVSGCLFFPLPIIYIVVRTPSQAKQGLYIKRSEARNSSMSYTTGARLSEKQQLLHINEPLGELCPWERFNPAHHLLYLRYFLADTKKAMNLMVTSVLLIYLCCTHAAETRCKICPPRHISHFFIHICLPIVHSGEWYLPEWVWYCTSYQSDTDMWRAPLS